MTDYRDFAILVALVILGLWLETINDKRGWLDDLLAPIPLALGGGVYICFEKALT